MAPWAINTHFLIPLLTPHLGTLLALLPWAGCFLEWEYFSSVATVPQSTVPQKGWAEGSY